MFASMSVIFAYFLFLKHQKGYEIRISGEAPKAAYFAGINPSKTIIFCLGTSGLLAGMAGLFEVAGPAGQITISFNSGYGFTAIIVAFLGRLNPLGILLAGLLMALTYIGGEIAQLMLGLPGASIQLLQGMLLFFLLATDIFTDSKAYEDVRLCGGGNLFDASSYQKNKERFLYDMNGLETWKQVIINQPRVIENVLKKAKVSKNEVEVLSQNKNEKDKEETNQENFDVGESLELDLDSDQLNLFNEKD